MKVYSYKKGKDTYYGFSIYLGINPLTGKERRTNRRGFRTKREAEIAYMRLRNGAEKKESDRTLEDIYEEWLPLYRTTVKGSTVRKVREIYKIHILPEFGEQIMARIQIKQIQNFVSSLVESGQTQYRRYFNYLNRLFKFALFRDYIAENPCKKVIIPNVDMSVDIADDDLFYTREELQAFLRLCKEDLPFRWYVFFRLAAYTGLRRGELLALAWEDVDLKAGMLDVKWTLSIDEEGKQARTPPKTKKSKREIQLDDETLQILIKHKLAQTPSEWVFPNGRGESMALSTPIKKMNYIVHKNKTKRITLHGLRHTHCSLLLMSGVPIKEVQRRMGHENIQTTMNVYAHVCKDGQKKVVDTFKNYMNE